MERPGSLRLPPTPGPLGSLAIGRGSIGLADTWRYGLLTMGIFTRAVIATGLPSARNSHRRLRPPQFADSGHSTIELTI